MTTSSVTAVLSRPTPYPSPTPRWVSSAGSRATPIPKGSFPGHLERRITSCGGEAASWPLWLVSIPALAYLLLAPHATPQRRLVAAWTLAAWAQVTLPGLYWPHYYLLPIAGAAITVAVCWADAASVLGRVDPRQNHAPSPRSILPATGRVFFPDIGYLRDAIPRGPRLPARSSPGVDHSIQRRAAVGRLA